MHTLSLPPSDRDEAPEPATLTAQPSTDPDALRTNPATNRIPGDIVNKATADLADNQRSAIRRLHAHYAANDLSLSETGALIGRSSATIGLIFRGKYEAKLDDVVSAINRFFDLEDRRTHARKLQFIPTKLTDRIWQICDSALELQRVAFLFGESQIGKTEALQAYAESHNHGSTIYVSVPTGGFLTHFLARLADALRISHRMKQGELRQRIIQAFDSRMLLIVDEAHQCISQSNSTARLQTIEFIREIFDQRHCGLVICATRVFKEAMERGSVEKLLRQVKRRRLCAADLPDRPTQEDLNTFAAAYGLPPSTGKAREIEAEIVNDEALGMWLSILRTAAKLSSQKKQKIEWAHVQTARLALRHLEGN